MADMLTLAVISQKGGAGKTTLATAIAVSAERAGRPNVLVDIDPQSSATRWAELRKADTPIVSPAAPERLIPVLEAARDGAALAAAQAAHLVLVPCRPAVADVTASGTTIDLAREAHRTATAVLSAATSQSGTRSRPKPARPSWATARSAPPWSSTSASTTCTPGPRGSPPRSTRRVRRRRRSSLSSSRGCASEACNLARPKLDIAAARRRETHPAPAPGPAPTGSTRPKSRVGKTGIVVYVPPELARALRHVAVDEDSSLQALGLEAFTALLERRTRRSIEE